MMRRPHDPNQAIFYNNCLEYLEGWTVQFEDIENFHYVTLKKEILWENVKYAFLTKLYIFISTHLSRFAFMKMWSL